MTTRWSANRAQAWAAAHPRVVGCNYVPSTAVNTTEFWQAETFDPATIARELALAAESGLNSCRVFIQELVWEADPAGFCDRFARFLTLAAAQGLSVMPVLFDDCAFNKREPFLGAQLAPIPDRMMTGWTASPGHARALERENWPTFAQYVTDLISAFAADSRILAWDLYNEPGNEGMGGRALPLLEAAFGWARAAAPSQPLTAGVWSTGEELAALNACMLAESDVLSFHLYGNLADTAARIDHLQAAGAGRPLLCTEWMARPLGSRIATHLPLFRARGVGCYLWGLVNGRTQTHLPWEFIRPQLSEYCWFHDLFHADGTPYDPAEMALLKADAAGR